MAEFEVGGSKYSSRKLDAFTAFHVARKLAPAVAPFVRAIGPAAATLATMKAGTANVAGMTDTMAALEPLARVLADLPAEDVDFVLKTCLGVVSRAAPNGGGWSLVWNKAADRLMFDDIDMMSMVAIAVNVIKADIVPFMTALPSASNGGDR
ncbi:hypothetical protein LB518_22760 [Mesorhizobium sp. BR1-1-16]|uniref:phage tail assembly chaperone n=1 Tax=Mesorhizobium sp. BR1-1-16 TaxID=2876653 RepID=UPI001CCA9E35|nr:hypothetical protein [Mesorhizobium sp. BR1-1-16]MBZ9939136.1 hypothetical protein [Mesorhizobium sp. BR1-1-16]